MMIRKLFRCVVSLVLCLMMIGSSVLPALAAKWNGDTAGGNAGGAAGATGGYAIHDLWFDKPGTIMALRFSFYNVDTGKTMGTTIDIWKDQYATDVDGTNYLKTHYQLSQKMNKLQLIEKFDSNTSAEGLTGIDLVLHTAEDCKACGTNKCKVCKTETAVSSAQLGAAFSLPEYTSELEEWQSNNETLNAVLSAVDAPGVGSTFDFQTGDYLLVEPIYPVQIDGTWYALTVTEMAVLGSFEGMNKAGAGYDGSQNNQQ